MKKGLLSLLVGLFFVIRLGEAHGWAPGWVRHYGDDLLCLPLVLSLVLAAHRLAGRPSSFSLPPGHGLAVLVVVAIYFEVVLPAFKGGAVGDPLDVLMYAGGFLFFHLALNGRGVTRSRNDKISGYDPLAH